MTGLRYAAAVGAAVALVLLAGHGVLRLGTRRWPHRAFGGTGAVGLCWLAGVVALGAVSTLVGVLGGSTRPLPVVAPVLVLLAVAGVVPLPARLRRDEVAAGPSSRAVRVGDAVAAAVALAVTVRIALLSARIPVSGNDEYALWMLRARSLSQLGQLDPRVFTDTAAGYQHLTYPLFLPALFGWLDGWAGRPTDAAAHLAVAVTVGALLAVAGAVLTRLAGPAAAAVALLLVVSVPTVLSRQSLVLMADVPVFAFAFCLVLVLLRWLALPRSDPDAGSWLVAAALLGAGAVGTKAEGLAFAGTAFAAALLLGAGRRRGVLLAGAAAVAVNLPWQAYTRRHELRNWVANGDTLTPEHVRDVLPWTGRVLRGMAEQWPGGSGAGVLLLAAVVPAAALAVRAGHGRLVLFVAVVVALDVGVLGAQYLVTAYGPPSDPLAGPLLDSQLRVTVDRVALVPAALLAVAVPAFAGLALHAPALHAPARTGPVRPAGVDAAAADLIDVDGPPVAADVPADVPAEPGSVRSRRALS